MSAPSGSASRLLAALAVALAPLAASGVTSPAYRGISYPARAVAMAPAPGGAAVNTWNGNVMVRHDLLLVRGRGVPLELYLVYNSDRRAISSPFGVGWNLSYNIRYIEDPAGNVSIAWGDGRVDRFAKSGAGFAAPVGGRLTLSRPAAGQYLLRSAHGLELRFASAVHRKLTSVRDPNGNTLALSYDSTYRLTLITDPGGRTYTFGYDDEGRLAAVTDPNLGRSWALAYDGQNRLVEIADPLGHHVGLAYDGGLLVSIDDPRGHAATIAWATPGGSPGTRLPVTIDKGGSTVGFGFDAPSRATTVTDPNGNPWRYVYDASGRLTAVVDPAASQASLAWDANQHLTAFTDRNGHSRTFAYDASGNLTQATLPVGAGGTRTAHWTYQPACNRVASFTDFRGNAWSLTYDARCNLVEVDDPAPPATKVARSVDAAGQVTSIVDRTGRVTTLGYDAYGNLATLTDGLGATTELGWDGGSRLTAVTDPLGHTFGAAYDAADRPISSTDALGNAAAYTYDEAGNLTTITDREGNVTELTRDALGRVTGVLDPLGHADTRTFDANGNLTSYVDRRGNTWAQAFDDRNRVTGRTNPLGSVWAYAYDDEGNLAARTDAKGQVTSLAYDDADRLTQQVFADGFRITRTYDANGNLLTIVDEKPVTGPVDSSYTYAYDVFDRVTAFTDVQLGTSMLYAHDAEGRSTSFTGPEGDVTSYAYDLAGRLASLATFGGTTTYTHDAAGRRTFEQRPNGVSSTFTYDANGLLAALSINGPPPAPAPRRLGALSVGPVIKSYAYTRDRNGRPVSVAREDGGSVAFTCDGLGRLVEEQHSSGNPHRTYVYDANGNRTALNRLDAGTSATVEYDAADRPSVSHGIDGSLTTTYTDDANGALVQIHEKYCPACNSITPLAYDARNRFNSYYGGEFTVTYDAFGRMLSLNYSSDSRRYAYSGATPVTISDVPAPSPVRPGGRSVNAPPAPEQALTKLSLPNPVSVTPEAALAQAFVFLLDPTERMLTANELDRWRQDITGVVWRQVMSQEGEEYEDERSRFDREVVAAAAAAQAADGADYQISSGKGAAQQGAPPLVASDDAGAAVATREYYGDDTTNFSKSSSAPGLDPRLLSALNAICAVFNGTFCFGPNGEAFSPFLPSPMNPGVAAGNSSPSGAWVVPVSISDQAANGTGGGYLDFGALPEVAVADGGADVTQLTGGIGINVISRRGENFHLGDAPVPDWQSPEARDPDFYDGPPEESPWARSGMTFGEWRARFGIPH